MNSCSRWVVALVSVIFLVAVTLPVSAEKSEKHKNLLSGPGFEDLDDSFLQDGMVGRQGGPDFYMGSWGCRTQKGEVRLTADETEKVEGQQSLKMEVVSEAPTRFSLMQGNRKVKPNTIYELRMFVKPYNVNWIMSQTRFCLHAKGTSKIVGGADRRMLNYSTAPEFREEARRIVTGPEADKLSLYISWQLQKKKEGLIGKPSMLWLDDMKLIEIGPAYPASGEYLSEDFEKDLGNWIMSEPGDSAEKNPRLSDENPHGGRQSLKFTGVWGGMERVFAEEISDCIVTIWFYDDLRKGAKNVRMIMLADADEKRAGLGVYEGSFTRYSYYAPRTEKVTGIKRTTGWHEFKWDYSKGEGAVLSIDGQQVGETDVVDSFRAVRLGWNAWRGFTCYVDDLQIELKE